MTLIFQAENGESVNLHTLLKMWCDGPEELKASDVRSVLEGAGRLGLFNQMALWIMVERSDLVPIIEELLSGSRRGYCVILQS